jgi:hypothetical protein
MSNFPSEEKTNNTYNQKVYSQIIKMRTTKLNQQKKLYVIAQDESSFGHKTYIGFDRVSDIFSHIENTREEDRNYYEVLQGRYNRRLYFDIDLNKTDNELPNFVDFYHNMNETLILSVKALFNEDLDIEQIIYTNSSTPDKFSAHVTIPCFNTSLDNMKILHSIVSKTMNQYENMPDIDAAVYGANQCFRLLGCHKKGKSNTKTLFTTMCSEYDTLVSYLSDSKEIFLIDDIQKAVDLKKKRKIQIAVNNNYNSDYYKALIDGLSPTRANNYEDWRNVCLALGGEAAGVDVAIAFSQKNTDKFNKYKTIELYEKGLSNMDNENRLGVGSIMRMLKEDNPEQFNKLCNTHEETYETPQHIIIEIMGELHRGLSDDEVLELSNDIEEVLETQEQKIERWLDAPYHWLYKPINEPLLHLKKNDSAYKCTNDYEKKYEIKYQQTPSFTFEEYSSKYVKPYPNKNTLVIKAKKGGGKTYALVELIKSMPSDKRIVFVSFRKTFSSEILKRLKPLGFVVYSGIDGKIDDKYKRVIVQVESLPRMNWTQRADLFIVDEVESVLTQIFSPTVKNQNQVSEKYEMFTQSSKKVIFMDADISEHTINHIKRTRTEQIHYIENTYAEDVSQYKEFYTSKQNVIFAKICQAIDNKEKIVIPCNRSIEFMNALKLQIETQYPHLIGKIQIYNSQTKRKKEIAAELEDVEKSWNKYEIIMYSPTVSAGVSFDLQYFDKCFCFFVNNGKINSMRQMISRVRHFSTNEYYYCLQSFGGSNIPDTFKGYEKHIESVRFDGGLPAYIFSKQSYDGTREYPYKTMLYHLWICNTIQIARDKNFFIFNFLREQYHAGITNLNYLPNIYENVKSQKTEVKLPVINQKAISELTKTAKDSENLEIARSDQLSIIEKEAIEKNLQDEIDVSESDILKLKRFNILSCYGLDQSRIIDNEFVKKYNVKSTKKAFHNRKLIDGTRSVKNDKKLKLLISDDNGYFNEFSAGNESIEVSDDLKKNYRSKKFIIILELLKIAGYKGIYGKSEITGDKMFKNIKKHQPLLISKMDSICDVFGKSSRRRPDMKKWTDKYYIKEYLRFTNTLLMQEFNFTIKLTKKNSNIYTIQGEQYDF